MLSRNVEFCSGVGSFQRPAGSPGTASALFSISSSINHQSRAPAADRLDGFARQGPISLRAVAAYSAFVLHAPRLNARTCGPGWGGRANRLAERGLRRRRRSTKHRSSPCPRRHLRNRQVLDIRCLIFSRSVMNPHRDAARLAMVDVLGRGQAPTAARQRGEIGADHAVFAAASGCVASAQLLLRRSLDVGRILASAIAYLIVGQVLLLSPSSPRRRLWLDVGRCSRKQHLRAGGCRRALVPPPPPPPPPPPLLSVWRTGAGFQPNGDSFETLSRRGTRSEVSRTSCFSAVVASRCDGEFGSAIMPWLDWSPPRSGAARRQRGSSRGLRVPAPAHVLKLSSTSDACRCRLGECQPRASRRHILRRVCDRKR